MHFFPRKLNICDPGSWPVRGPWYRCSWGRRRVGGECAKDYLIDCGQMQTDAVGSHDRNVRSTASELEFGAGLALVGERGRYIPSQKKGGGGGLWMSSAPSVWPVSLCGVPPRCPSR